MDADRLCEEGNAGEKLGGHSGMGQGPNSAKLQGRQVGELQEEVWLKRELRMSQGEFWTERRKNQGM